MQELAHYLKQARISSGLTLTQLQAKTKIRYRYLEAIERGAFFEIPGEVYLKGFLKAYAREVGLAPDDVLERYRLWLQQQPEAFWNRTGWRPLGRRQREISKLPPLKPRRRRPLSGATKVLAVALALFIVVVGAVAATFWTSGGWLAERITMEDSRDEKTGRLSGGSPGGGARFGLSPAAENLPLQFSPTSKLYDSLQTVVPLVRQHEPLSSERAPRRMDAFLNPASLLDHLSSGEAFRERAAWEQTEAEASGAQEAASNPQHAGEPAEDERLEELQTAVSSTRVKGSLNESGAEKRVVQEGQEDELGDERDLEISGREEDQGEGGPEDDGSQAE